MNNKPKLKKHAGEFEGEIITPNNDVEWVNSVRKMLGQKYKQSHLEFKGSDIEAYMESIGLGRNIPNIGEMHLPGRHDQSSHGNKKSNKKPQQDTSTESKKTGLVEVGRQQWADDQITYEVFSDGEKMFTDEDLDEGLVLVGLRGEHKGKILYTRPASNSSHQDMLSSYDSNSNVDDWAHFYIEYDQEAKKERLFIDAYYAGFEIDSEYEPTDAYDKVYDNINIAKKALVKAGVSPKRMVSILNARNEFGNRDTFTVPLRDLSFNESSFLEKIGARVVKTLKRIGFNFDEQEEFNSINEETIIGAATLALDENHPKILEFQEDYSTSAMVCFKIPDEIKDELESRYQFLEEKDNLHITLTYLGDTRTIDFNRVQEAVQNWCLYQSPVKGNLQGIARFVNGQEKDPLVMTFDSKQMPEVYEVLCDFLEGERVPFHKEHGFIPHMTLAYISKDEDMPIETIKPVELNFDKVYIVWNEQWHEYELSGGMNMLSWNAEDFGLIELHLGGTSGKEPHKSGSPQSIHGNKNSSSQSYSPEKNLVSNDEKKVNDWTNSSEEITALDDKNEASEYIRAFEKQPRYDGLAYRGMVISKDNLDSMIEKGEYVVNGVRSFVGKNSKSTAYQYADIFQTDNESENVGVVFRVKIKNARDISNSGEVLVRKTRFKIIGILPPENEGEPYFITIEQASDGEKMWNLKSVSEFHLPGQHDQSTHGNEEASTKDDIVNQISDYKLEIDKKLYNNYHVPKITFLAGRQKSSKSQKEVLGYFTSRKMKDKSGWYFLESEIVILPEAIDLHKKMGYFKNKQRGLGENIENTVFDEKDILLHEIGHHYNTHRVSNEYQWRIWDEYKLAHDNNSLFPSGYSKMNADEFFAESFVAYFRQRERFKAINPSMHDLIKSILEENGVGDIALSMKKESSEINFRDELIEVFFEDGTLAWIHEDELTPLA